jgi:translation initiation factor 1
MAGVAKKIPVSQSAQPLAVNPFAALEIADLPEGPPPVSTNEDPKPGRKAGRVVLRKEKSQRGGKVVIVVSDFAPHFSGAELEELARRAKQACGCGGTLAGREIELQGEDSARVRRFFEGEGFRVAGI